MRARALLLLALVTVSLLAACTQTRRLTPEERDRRSEAQIERLSD